MPISEIVLAAIGILATLAFATGPRVDLLSRGLKRLVTRVSQWIKVHGGTSVALYDDYSHTLRAGGGVSRPAPAWTGASPRPFRRTFKRQDPPFITILVMS